MNGKCLAVRTVVGERSFHNGGGTRAEAGVDEDLVEVGWSVEFDGGVSSGN